MGLVGGLVFSALFRAFSCTIFSVVLYTQSHPCEFAYSGQLLGIRITTLCASSHVACLPGLDEASDSNEHSTRALYRRAPELSQKPIKVWQVFTSCPNELRIGFKN
jgi:hypothetical protein